MKTLTWQQNKYLLHVLRNIKKIKRKRQLLKAWSLLQLTLWLTVCAGITGVQLLLQLLSSGCEILSVNPQSLKSKVSSVNCITFPLLVFMTLIVTLAKKSYILQGQPNVINCRCFKWQHRSIFVVFVLVNINVGEL